MYIYYLRLKETVQPQVAIVFQLIEKIMKVKTIKII